MSMRAGERASLFTSPPSCRCRSIPYRVNRSGPPTVGIASDTRNIRSAAGRARIARPTSSSATWMPSQMMPAGTAAFSAAPHHPGRPVQQGRHRVEDMGKAARPFGQAFAHPVGRRIGMTQRHDRPQRPPAPRSGRATTASGASVIITGTPAARRRVTTAIVRASSGRMNRSACVPAPRRTDMGTLDMQADQPLLPAHARAASAARSSTSGAVGDQGGQDRDGAQPPVGSGDRLHPGCGRFKVQQDAAAPVHLQIDIAGVTHPGSRRASPGGAPTSATRPSCNRRPTPVRRRTPSNRASGQARSCPTPEEIGRQRPLARPPGPSPARGGRVLSAASSTAGGRCCHNSGSGKGRPARSSISAPTAAWASARGQ